jgi:hypothetical protein
MRRVWCGYSVAVVAVSKPVVDVYCNRGTTFPAVLYWPV